jgi:uncharacterized membrane protein
MISRRRHFAKAVSWRVLGTIDTTLLTWIITGSFHVGVMVGGVEILTKTLLYYVHERVWYNYVKFGVIDD